MDRDGFQSLDGFCVDGLGMVCLLFWVLLDRGKDFVLRRGITSVEVESVQPGTSHVIQGNMRYWVRPGTRLDCYTIGVLRRVRRRRVPPQARVVQKDMSSSESEVSMIPPICVDEMRFDMSRNFEDLLQTTHFSSFCRWCSILPSRTLLISSFGSPSLAR